MVLPLLMSFVKALIGLFLGPSILLFGAEAQRAITVLNSLAGSGLLGLAALIAGLGPKTLFTVLEGGFFVAVGSATMSFAALKNEKGNAALKGGVSGMIVIGPVVDLISGVFYNFAGCTGIGDPTPDFPKGAWTGCSDSEFIVSLYVMKVVQWAATLGCAKIGIKFETFFSCFVSAMMGAGMTISSFTGVIFEVVKSGSEDAAASLMPILAAMNLFLTYGLAAFGFWAMWKLRDYHEAERKGEELPEVKSKVLKCVLGCKKIARPLLNLDQKIKNKLSNAKLGDQGTMDFNQALGGMDMEAAKAKVQEEAQKAKEEAEKRAREEAEKAKEAAEEKAQEEMEKKQAAVAKAKAAAGAKIVPTSD